MNVEGNEFPEPTATDGLFAALTKAQTQLAAQDEELKLLRELWASIRQSAWAERNSTHRTPPEILADLEAFDSRFSAALQKEPPA